MRSRPECRGAPECGSNIRFASAIIACRSQTLPWCGCRDDYHVAHPTAADVLLLVEVADSSLESDREVKLARYAAAGIPEVWIANLRSRQVEGHSDPVDGTYRSRRVVTAEGSISPLAFPDVRLTVGDFLLE